MILKRDEFSHYIDHTNLKAFVSNEDIDKLCKEAIDNGFAMVAVNQVQTKLCASLLKGTQVHVGAAISFPLGQTSIDSKIFETKNAIVNGADEIDYVINITEVKNKNFEYIEREMTGIRETCQASSVICKVIFENCYLNKDEISKLCEIARKVKPDFIKTSTGFGTGGATLEDVLLMKSIVGEEVKVKAAGGIRDLQTALKYIEAGASRIGTSSGLKMLQEFDEVYK